MSDSHSHSDDDSHNHHHPIRNYNRAFVVALILNGGFVLIEFGFGFLANSVALMADAGHNLSDVLGLLLAWIASMLTSRQPSARKTYGWRKTSILAAFLNAVFLLLTTGGIIFEALQRLVTPGDVQGEIIIAVAMIGILINTGTAVMFLAGRKTDLNIRAAFQHMMADAFVSGGVVVAGFGILWTRWLWLDPVLSLFISFLIVVSTWNLLKDSFHLIIDGVPKAINEQAVRTYLSSCSGVMDIHDLHVWSLSTAEIALTAHLVIPTGHPGDAFLIETAHELRDHFGIHHVTLQIEVGDSEQACLLESMCHIEDTAF